MDRNFFKQTRILDGGMGQELITKGMKPVGTLWSATALMQKKYHKLLFDTHIDFIKAGAEVIITNTFATRKIRLRENKVEDKFIYLNQKACEIARKTKKLYPHILIAGGLPPQNLTYQADMRPDKDIRNDFYNHAKILNPCIDFFYFDVLSSIKEFKLAIDAIKEFNKPYLLGAHISKGTKLPSGEKISDIKNLTVDDNFLGIILACVSPENFEINLEEIKNLNIPFGFKLNAFIDTKPFPKLKDMKNDEAKNPTSYLGHRLDLTIEKMFNFAKKFKEAGATILGGCCETTPAHIKKWSELKDKKI